MKTDLTYIRIGSESIIQAKLLSYYDSRISTLTASDNSDYIEARTIIAGMWGEIGQFAIDLAKTANIALSSVIKMLRNPMIVKFFSKIGWSFKKFWDILKKGYEGYKKIIAAIGEYISENSKIVRWTTEQLKKLDLFLERHPVISRLGGVVIAAIMVFLWFGLAFTGDFNDDMDFSDVLDALGGSYSLSDLFGGAEGAKLLLLLALGTVGISFPWPGPTSVHFIVSIITTLAKEAGVYIKKYTEADYEEAVEDLP